MRRPASDFLRGDGPEQNAQEMDRRKLRWEGSRQVPVVDLGTPKAIWGVPIVGIPTTIDIFPEQSENPTVSYPMRRWGSLYQPIACTSEPGTLIMM